MIFTALAVVSTAVGLNAQNMQTIAPAQQGHNMQAATPDDRAKRMTDHLNSLVQLTPDQYQKVMDVHKAFATKQDEMRKNMQASGGAPGGGDMRTQMKTMHDDMEAKLKGILTPDQWTKYEASRSPQRMQNGSKIAPMGGDQH